MRKAPALLLVAAAGIGAAPAPSETPTAHAPAPAPGKAGAPPVKLPGFAAALAEKPVVAGPQAWQPMARADAWAALAQSKPGTRQAVRWRYAGSLLAIGRGLEALGVLNVMLQDDPDLALVASFQVARGAALTLARRPAEALAALAGERLATNPEACAWRLRSMADAGLAQAALGQVNCALPAINARTGAARSAFGTAAAQAAIEAGRPAVALQMLRSVPDGDPAGNLYRGKAYLALGEAQAARLRLERVGLSGSPEQRMDARLSALDHAVATGSIAAPDALKQLDRITFTWRGGPVEERALRLTARLQAEADNLRGSLAAGAALFRYFDLGKDTGPVVAKLQAQLASALAPDSGMPLAQAAGLYWDFRDLAPSGAEGDLLVSRLADRLQATGLYGRAAELLEYQLTARTKDVAQGPLSVKVASLHILAGRPERALGALRGTDGPHYPQEMLTERRQVEAAALHLLGKTNEALAVLQDVPGGDRIRAEIYWKKQDWTSLAAVGEAFLPRPGAALPEVSQAVVLRHAIALAMLGREDGLARLRARYAAAFAQLPSAATFDVLTRPAGAIDPAVLSKAMASLPSASPAGAIGDLLDADPAPPRTAS